MGEVFDLTNNSIQNDKRPKTFAFFSGVASAVFAAIFLIIFGLDEAFGALEYGSCLSSEHGTIKGTCEMSCNRETGECTTTEEIISCDCAGERRTESYVYSYQVYIVHKWPLDGYACPDQNRWERTKQLL